LLTTNGLESESRTTVLDSIQFLSGSGGCSRAFVQFDQKLKSMLELFQLQLTLKLEDEENLTFGQFVPFHEVQEKAEVSCLPQSLAII
jgi:hypothetical protein